MAILKDVNSLAKGCYESGSTTRFRVRSIAPYYTGYGIQGTLKYENSVYKIGTKTLLDETGKARAARLKGMYVTAVGAHVSSNTGFWAVNILPYGYLQTIRGGISYTNGAYYLDSTKLMEGEANQLAPFVGLHSELDVISIACGYFVVTARAVQGGVKVEHRGYCPNGFTPIVKCTLTFSRSMKVEATDWSSTFNLPQTFDTYYVEINTPGSCTAYNLGTVQAPGKIFYNQNQVNVIKQDGQKQYFKCMGVSPGDYAVSGW